MKGGPEAGAAGPEAPGRARLSARRDRRQQPSSVPRRSHCSGNVLEGFEKSPAGGREGRLHILRRFQIRNLSTGLVIFREYRRVHFKR